MKKLIDLSIEELRKLRDTNQSVTSIRTGKIGQILYVSEEKDREDYVINILWQDGSKLENTWHCWLTNIVVVEDK